MFKWLKDFLGIRPRYEPTTQESNTIETPAPVSQDPVVIQETSTNTTTKVEKKPAKAAKPKPAAKKAAPKKPK